MIAAETIAEPAWVGTPWHHQARSEVSVPIALASSLAWPQHAGCGKRTYTVVIPSRAAYGSASRIH